MNTLKRILKALKGLIKVNMPFNVTLSPTFSPILAPFGKVEIHKHYHGVPAEDRIEVTSALTVDGNSGDVETDKKAIESANAMEE